MHKLKIKSFPRIRQTFEYDCGASVLQAVLVYYGIEERKDVLIKIAGTTQKAGTSVEGIIKTLKKYGLKNTSKKFNSDDIRIFIDKKIPIIIPLQAWAESKRGKQPDWEKEWKHGHYVVAVSYDKLRIVFMDPAAFNKTYLTWKEFEKRWHDVDYKGKKYINYGIAVYGKKPAFNEEKIIHMD